MTRAVKLGMASAALLGSIFVPPFPGWREPISVASGFLSCVLGLLAAAEGSKWWITVPLTVVAGMAIGWYIAMHSF